MKLRPTYKRAAAATMTLLLAGPAMATNSLVIGFCRLYRGIIDDDLAMIVMMISGAVLLLGYKLAGGQSKIVQSVAGVFAAGVILINLDMIMTMATGRSPLIC